MKKAIIFMICGLFFISACSNNNEERQVENEAIKPNELVLAIGGEADEGFDPTTGWGMYGSPLFQSTLLTYDENFEVENDLATDYQVSDNGLEYVVNIREDVTFSDHTPLTAKDVVFTFETAKKDRKSTRLNSSHVAISYAV